MTQPVGKYLTEPEWTYLTPLARDLVMKFRYEFGVEDLDLAVELAVQFLGDENAYELEED